MRQCLYESLRKRNKLARKDRGAVREGRESGMAVDGSGSGRRSVCLVGQTEPLDRRAVLLSKAFEGVKEEGKEEGKEEECRFYNTRSNDQPYSVSFHNPPIYIYRFAAVYASNSIPVSIRSNHLLDFVPGTIFSLGK